MEGSTAARRRLSFHEAYLEERRRRQAELGGKIDPVAVRHTQELGLLLLSLLLLPAMLWFSSGDPRLVVWRMSLMVCSYLFFWIHFLSITMPTTSIFFSVSYGPLMAFFIYTAWSHTLGLFAVYLSSVFTAALAGYALAERRQKQGTEKSAAAVQAPATAEEQEYTRCVLITAGFVVGMLEIAAMVRVVWVLLHASDYTVAMMLMHVSAMMLGSLFFLIGFATQLLLRGAFIGEAGFVAVTLCFSISAIACLFFMIVVGHLAGMLVSGTHYASMIPTG